MMNNSYKIFFGILFVSVTLLGQQIPNMISLNKSNLQKVNSDPTPSGNSVEHIDFMGSDVWIATSVGLSKSSDGGENWENYSFDNDGISALGINKDTIWVGTWHLGNYPNAADDDAVGSGLHYSVDRGETWIDIEQPQDELTDTVITYGANKIRNLVWANPVYNLTRAIGFQKNTIWIANYFAGLYKSNDVGKTWEKVVLPSDSINEITPDGTYDFTLSSNSSNLVGFKANLNHVIFTLKVIDDSTLVVGTAGGINLSTDGGLSWKKFNHTNQTNPISGNRIIDLDYDNNRNTIWAATWKADGEQEYFGLSSSSDMGTSWNTYLSGENIHDIAFTYDAEGNEEDIFVASNNGVFRSEDLGDSWLLAPEMIDVTTQLPITTNKFRAVNTLIDSDGYNNLWFGSESGTAKFIETGNLWEGTWKVLVSSPEVSKPIAFPNPFSPDEERIKIKYKFEGNSKSVSIRIFDFGMNLIRTVIQNVVRVGGNEYIDFWDGRDENSKIVPNGVYFYRIDIDNDEPLYGKIMVLM